METKQSKQLRRLAEKLGSGVQVGHMDHISKRDAMAACIQIADEINNAHAELVRACEAMRDEIMRLNNLSEGTWNDWSGSYAVDAALSAAKG